MKRLLFVIAFLASRLGGQTQVNSSELNTVLMHSTFLISGPKNGAAGQTTLGTVFILGIPLKTDPKRAAYTLVTAAHVLDDIGGETATILMRKRNPNGSYSAFSVDVPIRKNGHTLYTKHSSADVAVMYVRVPDVVPISLVSEDLLVTDKVAEEIELHPGDEAFCLGFPLAVSTDGGFPILRTGRIASYPLTPAATVKNIVFDLFIYPGNSGGPVYYVYDSRMMGGNMTLGRRVGILGLVIQQANSPLPEFAAKPLNLGIIIPAYFIREALDRLPPQ